MSFFTSLLEKCTLERYDGRSMWKFSLSDNDFEELKQILENATYSVDARDASLYYAEWWKRNYNGGTPKKEDIWNSFSHLPNCEFDSESFFLLAKKGGKRLGYKWIVKQNTLFFRTLLLQGGLPLRHITNNQGHYQNFLLAVLEEQPRSIEDFKFREDIVRHLPVSSRNDTIYENCFEIVNSILKDENIYDDLLSSNEVIKGISNALKVRKNQLQRKERISKPQNYWLLSIQNDNTAKITLRIGLADKYDKVSLGNILGIDEIAHDSYPLYIDDQLICTFKKMLSGAYRTVWNNRDEYIWKQDDALPNVYFFNDGEKVEITDFIHTLPDLDAISLWAKYSDNEWRLLRGNQSSLNDLALLMPFTCSRYGGDTEENYLNINNEPINWIEFEGEIEVVDTFGNYMKFQGNVQSFDWLIESKKPSWLLKHNVPVVIEKLKIHLYDDLDKKIQPNNFKVWIRQQNSNYTNEWQSVPNVLPKGYLEVKIEYNGVIAFDNCFNIGNLRLVFSDQKIDFAKIKVENLNGFNLTLNESNLYSLENEAGYIVSKLNTDLQIVPSSIKGTVGCSNQKKLIFQAKTPFSGTTLTDQDGKVIPTDQPIYLKKLHGMRILSTESSDRFVRIYNSLRDNVKIIKEIKNNVLPVIHFREELERVYYLADVMNYLNSVTLDIQNGDECIRYKVLEYTHTLDIEKALEGTVITFESEGDFDMFAVPLNCKSYQIDLLPLQKSEDCYVLPENTEMKQFIIVSSPENEKKLMPRFVNMDDNYEVLDKTARINQYHKELSDAYFRNEIWKQTLAYFDICIKQDIPFSTFDQIRAISRSSKQASRAFFYFGINQEDQERYIQYVVPKLEQELGFDFHWITAEDWFSSLMEVNELYDNKYFDYLFGLFNSYFQNIKMDFLSQFVSENPLEASEVYNPDINDMRSTLGNRILNELPNGSPRITMDYGFPIYNHRIVRLLIKSPIAVAEAICNRNNGETSLWSYDEDSERRKRNIQYSRELVPDFYNKVLKSCLSKIKK